METPNATIILDDNKARKIAIRLNLNVTGALGIIVKAKLQIIILSLKPILEKIKNTDFRISEDIEMHALLQANE